MSTMTYLVPDISCGHCVSAITEALEGVDGVDSIDVSIESKLVTVGGSFDDDAVRSAMDEAGYTAE